MTSSVRPAMGSKRVNIAKAQRTVPRIKQLVLVIAGIHVFAPLLSLKFLGNRDQTLLILVPFKIPRILFCMQQLLNKYELHECILQGQRLSIIQFVGLCSLKFFLKNPVIWERKRESIFGENICEQSIPVRNFLSGWENTLEIFPW